MSKKAFLTAGVLAGWLFLLAGLMPQSSTLMSAERAGSQPAAKKAALVPTESAGMPTGTAELAILKALAEPTKLDFVEEPLQGCIEYLSREHNIPIGIDRRALEDVGIGTDEPVTRAISGISLRSALKSILRDLDLTWTIDSGMLLITTPDQAELRLTTKTYDVGDLVVCQDEDGRPWDDYDSLMDTIAYTVAPDTWEEITGGPGTIEGCTFASAKVLVIRQTCQVHLEVAQLLDTIRKVIKAHGTDAELPVRKRPLPKPHRGMSGMGGNERGAGMMSVEIEAASPTDKPADAAKNSP